MKLAYYFTVKKLMTGAKLRQSYTQKVEDDDVYDG
jgi:hypothetical protein